ncbi:MAG TPA: TatD family hydrolase [Isosphaeraceae bacterium]|nr:TatD family hydrolase [Isosphaeraceae bacterium]
MSSLLVDTHAHLVDSRLLDRLSDVLNDAWACNVGQILSVGTTAEDSLATLELARANPGVFAAVGIHPNHAAEAAEGDWSRIEALSEQERVRAVGETGLDRHWDFTPFALQQEYLDRHLDLAERLGLPVVIHARECEADLIEQLGRRHRPISGVLHSFSGTLDDAKAFLGLGLHISFAGMVTFTSKRLDALREVAAQVPEDRLLVETDSPYLSPHPFRGQTNQPGRVALTAACVAEVRGLDLDALATLTSANARRLFAMPGDDLLRS